MVQRGVTIETIQWGTGVLQWTQLCGVWGKECYHGECYHGTLGERGVTIDSTVGDRGVTMETVKMGMRGVTMETAQWRKGVVPWRQYKGGEGCYHGQYCRGKEKRFVGK